MIYKREREKEKSKSEAMDEDNKKSTKNGKQQSM